MKITFRRLRTKLGVAGIVALAATPLTLGILAWWAGDWPWALREVVLGALIVVGYLVYLFRLPPDKARGQRASTKRRYATHKTEHRHHMHANHRPAK